MRTIQFCSTLILLILLVSCASNVKDPDVINLPAEHETPTVNGLRMNIFVEKKEFLLGEPINIYTVVRNKTEKTVNYSSMSYDYNDEAKLYYSVLNENGEPIEEFSFSLGHLKSDGKDKLKEIDYSLNPNSSIMYRKDIQSLVKKPGKYQIRVRMIADFETSILTSNDIKITIVE